MNLTRDRIRSIGLVSALVVGGIMTVTLMLHVKAVTSKVHAADADIARVQSQIAFLKTEFQTRSNQQALKMLNDLEFGYKAPGAGQYIEGERQLAALGMAPGPDAPAPIRYANAEVGGEEEGVSSSSSASLLAMVSPVTGATAAAVPENERVQKKVRDPEGDAIAREASDLRKRLARIEVAEVSN